MHCHLQTGVTCPAEVVHKQRAGPPAFVAGQIEGDQLVAVRQERRQLLRRYIRSVVAAQDSDELHADAEIAHARRDPVGQSADDRHRVEPVRLGHEPRAEPELEVVDALSPGVFDVLVRDPLARVLVDEDRGHPLEALEKRRQPWLRLHDLHVGA